MAYISHVFRSRRGRNRPALREGGGLETLLNLQNIVKEVRTILQEEKGNVYIPNLAPTTN